MFTCEICQKEFKSKCGLSGHKRVHGPSKGTLTIESIIHPITGAKIAKRNLEEYNRSLKNCKQCDKLFKPIGKRVFCSQSCSATFTNTARGSRSEETKQRISEGLKSYYELNPKEKPEPVLFTLKCQDCNKTFQRDRRNKYCSKKCQDSASSKRMSKRIVESGSHNFSIKVTLVYDNISYNCDSKLEAAGIIYLLENYNVSKIERCKSILNYVNQNNEIRRFNPDLYAIIDDTVYFVEIKQKWKKSFKSNHYQASIPYKKKALQEFCESKGYKWLWLTPSIEKLGLIYKNIDSYSIHKQKRTG